MIPFETQTCYTNKTILGTNSFRTCDRIVSHQIHCLRTLVVTFVAHTSSAVQSQDSSEKLDGFDTVFDQGAASPSIHWSLKCHIWNLLNLIATFFEHISNDYSLFVLCLGMFWTHFKWVDDVLLLCICMFWTHLKWLWACSYCHRHILNVFLPVEASHHTSHLQAGLL